MVADEPNVQRFTATTTIDPTSGTVGTSVTIQYFVTDATPNLPLPDNFQITGVRFGRYGQAQFTEQSCIPQGTNLLCTIIATVPQLDAGAYPVEISSNFNVVGAPAEFQVTL